MNTRSFLDTLQPHSDAPLVFELPDGTRVQPGYHVTEVMHAQFQSMDCGGRPDAWQQTIVQLQGPSNRDAPEFMTTRKFLSIFGRVVTSVPVKDMDGVRIEYGDAARPAVHYHVADIEPQENALVVRLLAPGVTCKPRARREDQPALDELPVLACC